MNELKAVLRQIVTDLEAVSVAVGGLEKALTGSISGELISSVRRSAASDVEKHFADLQKQISAIPSVR